MEKTAAKYATLPRIAMIGSIVAFDAQPSLAKMDRDNILGDLRDRQKWEPHMDARYAANPVKTTCPPCH